MNILEIEGLNKSFNGTKIIDNLSLQIPEGSVFGFLGKNGAGKTTTMKMVLGLLKPDSGNIKVCGEAVRFGYTRTNKNIGYLPDVPEFYSFMRPKEYLSLCGKITGMDDKLVQSRATELLSLVGLKTNKRIGGYSRGMKQRLGIAQALLHEPRLLICDEPTSALDPVGRKEILEILSAIKGKITVIFSTHILSDIERVCDRLAILNNGKIMLNGGINELKSAKRTERLLIEFRNKEDMQKFNSFNISEAMAEASESLILTISSSNIEETAKLCLKALYSEAIVPLKFELCEPTIESLFLEVVK